MLYGVDSMTSEIINSGFKINFYSIFLMIICALCSGIFTLILSERADHKEVLRVHTEILSTLCSRVSAVEEGNRRQDGRLESIRNDLTDVRNKVIEHTSKEHYYNGRK
jgi:hypothetical protein